jgi:hypothetical protein
MWSAISRADLSGHRSRIDFATDGLHIKYGSISQTGVVSQVRTQADFGLTYGVINAPVTGIRVWTQFAPSDGTANRFHMVTADSGGDIDRSVLHFYDRRAGSGDHGNTTDNFGLIRGAARGCAVMWFDGEIQVLGGTDTDYGNIVANNVARPSSGLVKTEPTEIDREIRTGPRRVLQEAPASAWHYLSELKPRPEKPGGKVQKRMPDGTMQLVDMEWLSAQPKPLLHFGPIAEDLLAVSEHLAHYGPDGVLRTNPADLLGVLWAAVADLDRDLPNGLRDSSAGPPPSSSTQ